jgi:hypothetical protein
MSVIISGDTAIVHSFIVPIVFDSVQEPGKRYIIADGKWTEVSNNITWGSINWFQKPFKGGKNEAFKNTFEQEVDGSKGKKYTVKNEDNRWSCTCPAFGFSGNSGCKHIKQIKDENGWN